MLAGKAVSAEDYRLAVNTAAATSTPTYWNFFAGPQDLCGPLSRKG